MTRSEVRIATAIVLSMGLHGMVMMQDFGERKDPVVRSFRKQVTFQLTKRKIDKPEPAVEKASPLIIPEEKDVVQPVDEIRKTPAKPRRKPVQPVQATVKKEVEVDSRTPQKKVLKELSPPIPREEVKQKKSIPTVKESFPESAKVIMARPLYRQNQPPPYPAKARRRHMEGTVILEVVVNVAGKVDSLEIKESSGHRVLDKAALASVRQWIFEPGMKNGMKVPMAVLVPVRFTLQ